MPSTVEYNPELGLVYFKYVGSVTVDEFRKDTITSIGLAKTNNTNLFLIDDSELESVDYMAGLYDLPRLYEELGADRRSKAALILPPPGHCRSQRRPIL